MANEKIICKHCNSTDVIRNGILKRTQWDSQKFQCRSCFRHFVIQHPKGSINKPTSTLVIPPVDERPDNFSWANYNEAQVKEKLLFLQLLESLCSYIPDESEARVGRPSASFKEMVFCLTAKLYEGLSSRRVSSDIRIAMQKGHITQVPHFNTILKYFNDSRVIPVLHDLIRLSAMPLKDFETTFAVDASGLSSAFYSRWLDYRFGNLDGREGKAHDWIKIHIICGVKSNIVTAILVSDEKGGDCPRFPELVRKTAEHFRIQEICADKGYISKKNIDTAFEVGAIPYIPFRSNHTGKAGGSFRWSKMFHYFQFHHEEFMARYHQRSNVEGTFSMLKRKFSTKLMLKNEVAQVNEALAMVLCHNICILVRELFENGVVSEFDEFAHLFPSLHINSVERLS